MKNDELRLVAPLGTSQNLVVLEVKNEELRVKRQNRVLLSVGTKPEGFKK